MQIEGLWNNPTVTLPSLVRVSTVDAVASELGKRVLDGSLPPGTFIREVQVAEQYGVARHTVRAATQMLVSEGLLRRAPNRGVHVPVLNSEDVVDIFRLRGALESEAVRLLVGTGSPPVGAVAASQALDALPSDATWADVVEADLAFHRGIIEGVGSPRLVRAYATAQAEIKLCMVQLRPHYERPEEVAAEHRGLLVALRSGDSAVAGRAFRRHWEEASSALQNSLTTTPSGRDLVPDSPNS